MGDFLKALIDILKGYLTPVFFGIVGLCLLAFLEFVYFAEINISFSSKLAILIIAFAFISIPISNLIDKFYREHQMKKFLKDAFLNFSPSELEMINVCLDNYSNTFGINKNDSEKLLTANSLVRKKILEKDAPNGNDEVFYIPEYIWRILNSKNFSAPGMRFKGVGSDIEFKVED